MAKRTVTISYKGQQFTRSTERIYSHAILVRHDYQRDRAATIGSAVEYARVNYAYYVREAEPASREHAHSEADLASFAKIAAMTFEQYHQRASAEAAAAIDAKRADGHYERFGVLEWCGRDDLARNTYDRALTRGYAEVVIVDVPQPA